MEKLTLHALLRLKSTVLAPGRVWICHSNSNSSQQVLPTKYLKSNPFIMQTRKIILNTAALVITVASSIAFKTANKFTAGHKLYVQVTNGIGEKIKCVTCRSVRTKVVGGIHLSSCVTINGGKVSGRNNKTFFTTWTSNKIICTHPFTKVQLSL
jgi:hypothetical protein